MKVREIIPQDAKSLVSLMSQLGYNTSESDLLKTMNGKYSYFWYSIPSLIGILFGIIFREYDAAIFFSLVALAQSLIFRFCVLINKTGEFNS